MPQKTPKKFWEMTQTSNDSANINIGAYSLPLDFPFGINQRTLHYRK